VAKAEATRMSKLIKWARAMGFAPEKA
jgi:hypothetical protein